MQRRDKEYTVESCVCISPFRCRMWEFHDRLEDFVTAESCAAEIESVSKQGQLVPALGRRLVGDLRHDVELVYGARRLFVARHLNIPLLVEVRAMTDAQAIAAMHSENFNRKDLSPYERGLSYTRWLRAGIFKSQEELAKSIGISPAQVCRLIRLARLPTVIIDAFRSPVEISETWGLDLIDAWENPAVRPQLARRARRLAAQSPRLPARCAHLALMMAVTPGRQVVRTNRDEVVKSAAGAPLFRIRHNARAVVLMLPTHSASPANVALIRSSVAAILDRSNGSPQHAQRHLPSLSVPPPARSEHAALEEA